jgi:hypothetical protein
MTRLRLNSEDTQEHLFGVRQIARQRAQICFPDEEAGFKIENKSVPFSSLGLAPHGHDKDALDFTME